METTTTETAAVDCSADGGHFTFVVEAGRQAYQADAWQDGRCACFAYGWSEAARAEEATEQTATEAASAASPACPEHGLLGGPDGTGCRLCADTTSRAITAAVDAAGPVPSLAQPDPAGWLLTKAATAPERCGNCGDYLTRFGTARRCVCVVPAPPNR